MRLLAFRKCLSDSIDLEVSGIALLEDNYKVAAGDTVKLKVELYGAAASKTLKWSIFEVKGNEGSIIYGEDVDIKDCVAYIANYDAPTSITLEGINVGTAYVQVEAGIYGAIIKVDVL